jgi:NAD(P)-dependent dehydrogenase (short-subunit alcohol dehydrogenase family)
MRHLARRVVQIAPTMLGALILVFVVMRVLPGDPAIMLLGTAATPDAVAALRRDLGVDRPRLDQFVAYLTGACSLGDWRTILGVNLDGAFFCARAAAPYLRASPGGAIVDFASIAARKGLAPGSEGSSGPYAVAKAGIMALTRQLAVELGADGVRVNCVAPGVVLSGRARRLMAAIGDQKGPEGLASAVPLGRFATVDEVAGLVVALCTDETSYMTGVTLDVNGAGYMA